MTGYVAELDFGAALATPRRCPRCGHFGLSAVAVGDRTAFRCGNCEHRWYVAFGTARPLPRTADEPHAAEPRTADAPG